jgi:hypothetical protein
MQDLSSRCGLAVGSQCLSCKVCLRHEGPLSHCRYRQKCLPWGPFLLVDVARMWIVPNSGGLAITQQGFSCEACLKHGGPPAAASSTKRVLSRGPCWAGITRLFAWQPSYLLNCQGCPSYCHVTTCGCRCSLLSALTVASHC